MSEESASLLLWVLGVIVFLIAIYSVSQVPKEMRDSTKGPSRSGDQWPLTP